jgi:hypothetical protein
LKRVSRIVITPFGEPPALKDDPDGRGRRPMSWNIITLGPSGLQESHRDWT